MIPIHVIFEWGTSYKVRSCFIHRNLPTDNQTSLLQIPKHQIQELVSSKQSFSSNPKFPISQLYIEIKKKYIAKTLQPWLSPENGIKYFKLSKIPIISQ